MFILSDLIVDRWDDNKRSKTDDKFVKDIIKDLKHNKIGYISCRHTLKQILDSDDRFGYVYEEEYKIYRVVYMEVNNDGIY